MKPFEGKAAIVTGGASGIGKSICHYLALQDARMLIADSNREGAQVVASAINAEGGSAKAVCADVADPRQVRSLIEDAVKDLGCLDYLFNNAGIGVNGEFQDMSLDHMKGIMEVNYWGAVYGCYYAYPIMMKQKSGHIINTASLAGLIPGGLTTGYSASKHAVVGFSLTLRSEARQYGIKVSVLCPGYIRTNIQKTTPNVSEFMNSEQNRKMNGEMKFPAPEDCIDQIMRGVRRNKGIIISPTKHKLYWWIHRVFPGFIPNMFHRIITLMKKQA